MWYNDGTQFVEFAATDSGRGVFYFPIGGIASGGFIGGEGYVSLDLTDLIPSDISILRLIPLN